MDKTYWMEGTEVSLPEILDRRERRAQRQQELLKQYQLPLICCTLNIIGPVKYTRLISKAFHREIKELKECLWALNVPIIYHEAEEGPTGCEGFFVVDGDIQTIKENMVAMEDIHPLGRLFDMDLIRTNGEKMSRSEVGEEGRKCLLCSNPVFVCSRSRAHSVSKLVACQNEILWDWFATVYGLELSRYFTKGMLYEVMTTPKPGLVDRWHNGAHKDMDIQLFMKSIDALQRYYQECARTAILFEQEDLTLLFQKLRQLGLEAEHTMLRATNGVNTHKGLIFSGGILCAAAGRLYAQTGQLDVNGLGELCRAMTADILNDFTAKDGNSNQTVSHGEQLYQSYGITGIRGEAREGFPLLLKEAYPQFLRLQQKHYRIYGNGQKVLLSLIAKSQDTNMIIRSDYDTVKTLQNHLDSYLKEHPLEEIDERSIIRQLDDYFISKNISPGGSADLLALVYFLYFVQVQL